VDYFRESNIGLLTLKPISKPFKSMLRKDITRETIINNNNITYNKNDYNNKNKIILILTRYIYSP
jgi:hypothetical protein